MDGCRYRLRRKIRLPGGWALLLGSPKHNDDNSTPITQSVAVICLTIGYVVSFLLEAARAVAIVLLAAALLHWFDDYARAAPVIPREAKAYRTLLVRVARVEWGMTAPVATFAAQVHQESEWNPDAVSPVGAVGLAQFMPATARWLPQVAPQTGNPMPRNPAWALRAMVAYDHWLHERVSAATSCDRMAMALSAYNGGLGWVQRDARLAASRGFDPRRWWNHIESVNAGRSRAAFTENRGYPRRILHTLEPLYEAAGWGVGSCPRLRRGHS